MPDRDLVVRCAAAAGKAAGADVDAVVAGRHVVPSLVAERLTPDTMAAVGLAWTPVARLLDEQRHGRRDHSLKIWSLLVLDAWRAAQ